MIHVQYFTAAHCPESTRSMKDVRQILALLIFRDKGVNLTRSSFQAVFGL